MRIFYYLKHRFFNRTHIVDTKLTRGQHWDMDTRLLHGSMETLVHYVEVECAHMVNVFVYEDAGKMKGTPRELGQHYLDWEMCLETESSQQSATAKEVKALYLWWKDERPKRMNPWDSVELDELDKKHGIKLNHSSEVSELYHVAYENIHEVEKAFDEEDDRMLCRLIAIRHGCWT